MKYTAQVLSQQLLMKLHHKYSYISEVIHNDKICVAVEYNYVPKYGKIDLNGNIIIPVMYDNMICIFNSYGYHIVKLFDNWGVVDDNNEILIPFIYDKSYDIPIEKLIRKIKIKSLLNN